MNYAKIQTRNGERNVQRDLSAISFNVAAVSLGAGASETVTINTESDSRFIWLKTAYSVNGGVSSSPTTFVIPSMTVQIIDSGSGRTLFQRPLQISSMAGHMGLPFVNALPRTFSPNSAIQVLFTNTSSATAYGGVSLIMHGYKEWDL